MPAPGGRGRGVLRGWGSPENAVDLKGGEVGGREEPYVPEIEHVLEGDPRRVDDDPLELRLVDLGLAEVGGALECPMDIVGYLLDRPLHGPHPRIGGVGSLVEPARDAFPGIVPGRHQDDAQAWTSIRDFRE